MRRHAVTAAFGLLLSGCNVLLSADFEADSIGNLPSTRPAGMPANDIIFMWASDLGPVERCPLRVVPSPFSGSRKALRIGNVASTDECLGFIWYISERTALRNVPRTVAWTAQKFGREPFTTTFGFYHRQAVISIKYENGRVFAKISGESAFRPIGTYADGRRHSVILSFNNARRVYSISLSGGGTNAFDSGVYRPYSYAGESGDRLALFAGYDQNNPGYGRYFMDDVLISARRRPD